MKMITLSKWQVEILREAFAMLAEKGSLPAASRRMKGATRPASDEHCRPLAAEGLAEDLPPPKGVMAFAV